MNKSVIFLFLALLIDIVFVKKFGYTNFLQSKSKSLRNSTFFTSLSDRVFQYNDTRLMVPSNWTASVENNTIYLISNETRSDQGFLLIKAFPIPENLENKTQWYTNIIERITGNEFNDNLYIPFNSISIGDFDGGRYIFRKLMNSTVNEGYVVMLANNSTMFVIFGMYDIRQQSMFRSAVDTVISSLQQGSVPTGLMSRNVTNLFGCWENYENMKDFTGNSEIYRTFNFTNNYEYTFSLFTYTSVFGDPKIKDSFMQNGKFMVEGNVITINDINNRLNVITFDRIEEAILLNDKLYVSCS